MKDWYRPRPYPHFDSRISRANAEELATNPDRVSKHSFLPFISYEKRSRRYKPEQEVTAWKPRPISYASHADSQIYGYYSQLLSRRYNALIAGSELDTSVIAYRSLGKSNIDHAAGAFEAIKSTTPCIGMAFDVEGFFESLDHQQLRRNWCKVMGEDRLPEDHYRIFRSLTSYASVRRKDAYEALGIKTHPTGLRRRRLCSIKEFRENIRSKDLIRVRNQSHGIPQGSPISAVLSNIYMHSFDMQISKEVAIRGGLYRRYCDDILIICPESDASSLQHTVKTQLLAQKLTLSETKTETAIFPGDGTSTPKQGLQYLGLTFDGTRCLLRPSSISRFYQRMKRAVRKAERESRKRGSSTLLFQSQLYKRFSHNPGSRSFVRLYALRASKEDDMHGIKKQLARHHKVLAKAIREANARIAADIE
tara:strand:+ start:582 stop:1844 length:1263 start_codon:yes stop_codon:yes gene_type:complete